MIIIIIRYGCLLSQAFSAWYLLEPPQLRFPYTSSAFWFKQTELSAWTQSLHPKKCPSHLSLPTFITLTEPTPNPQNGERLPVSRQQTIYYLLNIFTTILHKPSKHRTKTRHAVVKTSLIKMVQHADNLTPLVM